MCRLWGKVSLPKRDTSPLSKNQDCTSYPGRMQGVGGGGIEQPGRPEITLQKQHLEGLRSVLRSRKQQEGKAGWGGEELPLPI